MRISDWSSDVCSSDLIKTRIAPTAGDDADLAWWFRSHRACAACGANMPVFSRIRDPMFGFIKKTKAPAYDESQPFEPESAADRKSVVAGKSVSIMVNLGGSLINKKKNHKIKRN